MFNDSIYINKLTYPSLEAVISVFVPLNTAELISDFVRGNTESRSSHDDVVSGDVTSDDVVTDSGMTFSARLTVV